MSESGKLFRVNKTGNEIWETYLHAFNNPLIFRDPSSNEHNCNHCKNFIRRYGNIVSINENNQIVSLFDVEVEQEYSNSFKAVSDLIKTATVEEVFFETYNSLAKLKYEQINKNNSFFRLGVEVNHKQYNKEEAHKYGVVKEGQVIAFNHLHVDVPKAFVDQTGKSIEAIQGSYRDAKNVFARAMQEISLDTLNLVKDLINQGSLLDGQTHLYKLNQFIPLKETYDSLAFSERDNFCWVASYQLPIAKFKNELIGVLCSELSEGKELNEACKSWNKRVDPINYMKTTAPITKKQIEEAKKFVEENGYTESFNRRLATLEDIKVSEILHSNVGKDDIPKVSIFDNVKPTSTRHKRAEFDGVDEVTIDKFMSDILPSCTSIEAYLQNTHDGNMVTLTTSNIPDSKKIFKWDNNYSWTFNGNLAGKSQIKENVKNAGGRIEALLRCSLQWNDEDTRGIVDLDLHCENSLGQHIYYGNKKPGNQSGWLDVDMQSPSGIGIENITWQNNIPDGDYRFYVINYNGRQNKGFKAEIEFNGEVFNYHYPDNFYSSGIRIATITVKNGNITIVHHLPESSSNRDIYGLETNNFHKVNLICLSPNHWGNNQVGNKHYFFMLDNCKTPNSIRGFHNENLLPELVEHRKVLEVLGTTNMIEVTENTKQLSGLGFNSSVKDELIVRVQGSHKRVLKIKF